MLVVPTLLNQYTLAKQGVILDLLFQINSLIYVYPRFYDLIPIASLSILIAILINEEKIARLIEQSSN